MASIFLGLNVLIHWRWVPPNHTNGGECPLNYRPPPHPLKMCYQVLKNKAISIMKELDWVNDGLCIYSGGCHSTGGQNGHNDHEGQGQWTPKTTGILTKLFDFSCPDLWF